jgi:hypothetical protein
MRLTCNPRVWLVASVCILLLASCAGQAGQSPTQTPVVIIVTGETPDGTPGNAPEPSPTPDIIPTPYVCRAEIVEQSFENGRMFWVGKTFEQRCQEEQDFEPGSGEIWVAIFDESGLSGEWLIFEDDWDSRLEPEEDPDLVPPEEGLYQPVRGFGKVWREKLSAAQREAIGWATVFEIRFVTEYRYEAGGFVDSEGQYVPRPGLHIFNSFGDERFFFDEPSQTFDYVPAD